jgi:diadenosine tetraphosphatase ApaH/serine/threonine PP2A family protein phosphatase
LLSVVCWKWQPMAGYRSKFGAEHVNTFARMVRRHLHIPHEIVCVTDNSKGIAEDIRIVPLWSDFSQLASPHGGLNPSCYRRLRAFAGDMRWTLGERFVSVDLDVVIVDDVTPLWDRPEPFVIWGDQLRGTPYNGSMWMMDAGARSQVFNAFDPHTSPKKTLAAKLLGSDQAWISYILGPGEKTWTKNDGVLAFRTDIRRNHGKLPAGARIVFFQGNIDPWNPIATKLSPWIKEHYR